MGHDSDLRNGFAAPETPRGASLQWGGGDEVAEPASPSEPFLNQPFPGHKELPLDDGYYSLHETETVATSTSFLVTDGRTRSTSFSWSRFGRLLRDFFIQARGAWR